MAGKHFGPKWSLWPKLIAQSSCLHDHCIHDHNLLLLQRLRAYPGALGSFEEVEAALEAPSLTPTCNTEYSSPSSGPSGNRWTSFCFLIVVLILLHPITIRLHTPYIDNAAPQDQMTHSTKVRS